MLAAEAGVPHPGPYQVWQLATLVGAKRRRERLLREADRDRDRILDRAAWERTSLTVAWLAALAGRHSRPADFNPYTREAGTSRPFTEQDRAAFFERARTVLPDTMSNEAALAAYRALPDSVWEQSNDGSARRDSGR